MNTHDHITTLGYQLESTSDAHLIAPLLQTAGLDPVQDHHFEAPSEYLIARTRAGGLAACAGWTKLGEAVVVHSLVVAPPARGSGVGVSLLATALAHVMDHAPVEAIYLMTGSARRFFSSYGFTQAEARELPAEVSAHATFVRAGEHETPMVRHYKLGPRGLDQCAFRLLENRSEQAVLPVGSVLFFKQSGEMIEANYRGGTISRGHIMGRVEGEHIRYLWHAYSRAEELLSGEGHWKVSSLEDGRRELREINAQGDTLLILREV